MTRDVSIPLAGDEPVAVALNDPAIRVRLSNAARAFLGKRAGELSPIQRTAEAEVIVQEAASRAWSRREQFDGSKEVVKWLVGFVINVSREFAKNRSRGGADRPEGTHDLETLAVDPSQPIEDAIADRLLVEHLLARLSQLDRQVVEMKYCEEMTCAEIGQRMGMSENAVRVRVHRAVLKLRTGCGLSGEAQP
jgi:RNA polymerase sigma-70 factor (ECF subfamily)